jgi:hypothetical protein
MRSTGTRPTAIRAQGLERRFSGVMAVGDLDLEIASGEPSARDWPSTREEISL